MDRFNGWFRSLPDAPVSKLFFFGWLILSLTTTYGQPKKFRLPEELPEVSGLYYAGPDSLWWHNDGGSGSGSELFLTDNRGALREVLSVPGVDNVDWEDLATDDRGNIYIGDFGNNGNRRRNLRIYIFDPGTGAVDSILFAYPDQQAFPPPPEQANFDMEGFFWFRDSLHLFSKNRLLKGSYFTKHYVIPAVPGTQTPIVRDSLYLKKRVVSGAAISRDGQQAVLLTYWYKKFLGFIPVNKATIFMLNDFDGADFLSGRLTRQKIPVCLTPAQYEAVDFIDDRTLLVAREKVLFFKQKARRLRLKENRRAVP